MKKIYKIILISILLIIALCIIFRERPILENDALAQIRLLQMNVDGKLEYLPETSYNEEKILEVLSEGRMRLSFDIVNSYAQGDILYEIYIKNESSHIGMTVLLGDINQVTISTKKWGYKIINSREIIDNLDVG